MRIIKNRKAFTLIEIIVVIAIIAVLVLLATPHFMGQTKKARRTQHLQTVNELEKAAERYYADHQDWPRLSDEPYTPAEVQQFADKIYNTTGVEADLAKNENYYEINYDELDKYVKIPEEDKDYYVFSNPVGEFFYLEDLNPKPERFIYDVIEKDPEVDKEETVKDEPLGEIISSSTYGTDEVVFKGLNAGAFDGNPLTSYVIRNGGAGNTVTWEGDLTDREIEIRYRNSYRNSDTSYVYFKDKNNNNVPAVGSNNSFAHSTASKAMTTVRLVVPKNATSIYFSNPDTEIYDITTVAQSNERPTKATIRSSATPSSITLDWTGVNRAIIRKNGEFLYEVNSGTSYTDKPLYADSEHTYEVILLDESGNGQRHVYTTKTTKDVVAFRGLSAAAFDGNSQTSYVIRNGGAGNTVTWEGDLTDREIEIRYRNSYRNSDTSYVYFKDKNNNNVPAVGSNNSFAHSTASKAMTTVRLVVPENATSIYFSNPDTEIYDITTVAQSNE